MDGGATEDAGAGSFAILGGLERWWAYRGVAAWCLALFGSVLLNATLLFAFLRRPGLRNISNRFVMNLICSNLLAVTVLSVLLILDSSSFFSLSDLTASFCAISEGSTAFVTTSSILSVLLIGVDQYLAVVDPLRYRTRIDKLRCGLLILAVWLLALAFGMLASLNPQPRSLWYLCSGAGAGPGPGSFGSETLRLRASIVLSRNASEAADLEIDGEIRFAGPRNRTAPGVGGPPATYGLVYALVYALLGYLVPFLAICWIYASIYRAARNNSERMRRTGSRPILSSGSFSEESGPGAHRPLDCGPEDFRRIPKISSLSSIDENSEAAASQLGSGPLSRSAEHVPAPGPEDAVVFVLGSSKVEIPSDAKDSTKSKVPISALKAKFLSESRRGSRDEEELVRSKFPDVAEQRRKSSHDLMYEEMMLGCNDKHPYEYPYEESTEEEEEEEEEEDEEEDEEVEDEEEREVEGYEEALPMSVPELPSSELAATRSSSVNFDLGEGQEVVAEEPSSCGEARASVGPSSPSHQLPIVTITPPGQRPGQAPAPPGLPSRPASVKNNHGYINNLKYKISNGSLFKYREETRAARISALVVVMGFICWTPYVYLLVVRNLPVGAEFASASGPPSASLEATALGFLVLATFVTPLLFGYRSRRVKRELQRFFCFKRELSYKNNRSLMAKKVLRRRHSGATILSQFVGESDSSTRYNIFNCLYGRNRSPKEKVQFVQVPETALAVETCRSSFSSGASTQISSTSTDENC